MNLPINTYYNQSGVLSNRSFGKKDLKMRVIELEKEVATLKQQLKECQIQQQSIASLKK